MKIVIVVNRLIKSGPMNVVSNLIKNIPNGEIYLISLHGNINSDFEEYDLRNHCKKIITLKASILDYISPRRVIKKISLITGGIDVLHTHGIRPDFLFSRNRRVTQITTIHNFMFDDYPQRYGNVVGMVMTKIHVYALNRIKYVILCSGSLMEQYNSVNMKFPYINNGISQVFFDYDRFSNSKEHESLQLISVGHLSSIKNSILIAESLIGLDIKYPSRFKMIFLGDGEQRSRIESLNIKSIELRGYVYDVKSFLNESDFFISSSKTEGMPNAALEALAAGLPLILSDIPSHRYLKTLFPKSILIFKTGDDLINILEKTINKSLFLEPPCLNILGDNFSGNAMSKKYYTYYELCKIRNSMSESNE